MVRVAPGTRIEPGWTVVVTAIVLAPTARPSVDTDALGTVQLATDTPLVWSVSDRFRGALAPPGEYVVWAWPPGQGGTDGCR